jgi:hypothetical protein
MVRKGLRGMKVCREGFKEYTTGIEGLQGVRYSRYNPRIRTVK